MAEISLEIEDGTKISAQIHQSVVLFVRGANNGDLLKMFFDGGGHMCLRENSYFVLPNPVDEPSQKAFFSFYLLTNERGEEGRKLLNYVLGRFLRERLDCHGKIIRSN